MDDAATRAHIQKHAEAVVNGDMEAILADISEELRPRQPELAQTLPKVVTSAEVLSVEVGDDVSVALIRYSGEGRTATTRSHWRDLGGDHPVIVHSEPAD